MLSTFLKKTIGQNFVANIGVWPILLGGGLLLLAVAAVILIVCIKKKGVPSAETESTDSSGIKVGTVSKIGARAGQQDSFAVTSVESFPQCGILTVVADGMGGLADGDQVSQLVTACMAEGFEAVDEVSEHTLLTLAGEANQQVNCLLGEEGLGKSGSTLVAGLIHDGKFYYISVGDSRIALYRGGQLIQLNREHTFLHDLQVYVMNGLYDMQDDEINRRAGNLTSYIGMGRLKYVDIPEEPVKVVPGDKFILMSDGVYNALEEEELVEALEHEPQTAADRIDEMITAKAFRNQDNYTAIILEV